MPIAFLKKALRLKKSSTEKDFDEFLRVFENVETSLSTHLSKSFKKKFARYLVIKQGGSVMFDSSSNKDCPLLHDKNMKVKFLDHIFGSYSMSSCKDAMFPIKIHDLDSSNQILITRILSNIEILKRILLSKTRSTQTLRKNSWTSDMFPRADNSPQEVVAACIIINLNWASTSPTPPFPLKNVSVGTRRPSLDTRHSSTNDDHSSECQHSEVTPKRLHRMLFEHCAQVSIMVESLVRETLLSVCKRNRICWNSGAGHNDCHCNEKIMKAFDTFLDAFNDMCFPRLHFPTWATLNSALAMEFERISPLRRIVDENSKFLLTCDADSFYRMDSDGASSVFESLSNTFIRYCVSPLLSKGSKEQTFLSQVITAVLIMYPGWISSLIPSHSSGSVIAPNIYCTSSDSVSSPNWLLEQLLLHTGCTGTNLDALGGSVFNCTILTGQAKKQLMALLYFITYFLRFPILLYSSDSVPDLGNADLFHLETQKRRRPGSKSRRKSGSVVLLAGGEAHDSGISSQEDLAASYIYSASTGSSPTHAFGTALCLPHILTLDQCRIAEAAAQRIVIRESAAAAAAAAAAESSKRASTFDGRRMQRIESPHSRYTEIPLLFEKCVVDRDDVCLCLPLDPIPTNLPCNVGQFSSMTQQSYSGHSSSTQLNLEHIRSISDSSPALNISNTIGALGRTNPRWNPSSVGASSTSTGLHKHSSYAVSPTPAAPSSTRTANSLPERLPLPHLEFTPRERGPSLVIHNLIGGSVTDRFCRGLVLQATNESFDSFHDRLQQQLTQWLTMGPLVIRGYNLSTHRLIDHELPAAKEGASSGEKLLAMASKKPTQWTASALIVNVDTKTVQVLTAKQPATCNDLPVSEEQSSSGRLSTGSRLSLSSLTSHHETTSRLLPVQAAPLVVRLLEKFQLVFERTDCPMLALRDLEANLRTIAFKSHVLADLLTVTGATVLNHQERMAAAACCSVKDLPLLLSTAAAHNLALTVMLNEYLSDMLWIS